MKANSGVGIGKGDVMFADVTGPSFIFWPVGCGDSTTIIVSESEVVQVDLNDKVMAEDDDNEHIPLVDELVAKLLRSRVAYGHLASRTRCWSARARTS